MSRLKSRHVVTLLSLAGLVAPASALAIVSDVHVVNTASDPVNSRLVAPVKLDPTQNTVKLDPSASVRVGNTVATDETVKDFSVGQLWSVAARSQGCLHVAGPSAATTWTYFMVNGTGSGLWYLRFSALAFDRSHTEGVNMPIRATSGLALLTTDITTGTDGVDVCVNNGASTTEVNAWMLASGHADMTP